jgi:hypothetical protein
VDKTTERKGKPAEKRGRKTTGLNPDLSGHDSRVAETVEMISCELQEIARWAVLVAFFSGSYPIQKEKGVSHGQKFK